MKANSTEPEEAVWVVDMVMRDGVLKRVAMPDAKISEIGDITYKKDEAVGYEITLTCLADTYGNTHYEFIEEPAS